MGSGALAHRDAWVWAQPLCTPSLVWLADWMGAVPWGAGLLASVLRMGCCGWLGSLLHVLYTCLPTTNLPAEHIE